MSDMARCHCIHCGKPVGDHRGDETCGLFGSSRPDRFHLLNPEEALRILIQNHLNTISEISLHKDFRVIGYLDWLAELEEELKG